MLKDHNTGASPEQEIEARLGLVPAMFRMPDAAQTQGLWHYAKACYLDNPLPALFKERLCVAVARSAGSRYRLARHAGFLLGYGRPAGDAATPPQSPPEVLALLGVPASSAKALSDAIAVLQSHRAAAVPASGSMAELAVFQCCAAIMGRPASSAEATAALRKALGPEVTERVLALLLFLRTADTWALLHPEVALDPDLQAMMASHPDIAARIDEIEAERSIVEPRTVGGAGVSAQESRFIAKLSHDLRNPVAAISAVSDMFQMVGVHDERLRHACGILQRQTLNLTEALDNIIDASNLALGKVSIERLPVPISEVLNSVLEEVAPKIRERGLNVAMRPSPQGICVTGDRTRLVQMFQNILTSVIRRAAAPAGIAIAARVAGDKLTVTISAGREGLIPENGPPSMATDSARPDEDAGLSLSSARVIAELHQGSVQGMAPQAGIPHIFRVILPITPASMPGDTNADKTPPKREKQRTRVLAIEDNRDFAQLFRHMLEIMGCELDITSDARIGFSIARDIRPQLIFCDLGLPGDMDGFDFARAVRADPDLAHIPLVAVSGYTSPEDRQRALAAGFDRVCAKPVKFADISAALANFSNGGRAGR
jgi:signal transduction histidine kinase/ActR/RegA family two-component response regulator